MERMNGFISILLVLCLVLGIVPVNAFAESDYTHSAEADPAAELQAEKNVEGIQEVTTATVTSGTCGENVTWELDAQGTLTIFGKGAMDDYATASGSPWYSYRGDIKKLVIADGVTTIGDRAFYNCTELLAVTIGQDVETIGTYAFRGCSLLEEVRIPASVTDLKGSAFRACTNLAEVTFEGNAPILGNYVFNECAEGLTIRHWEGTTGYDAAPWTDFSCVTTHAGRWVIDVAATCVTDGSRHLTCSYCGGTFTEVILAKNHNYVDGVCTICHEIKILYSGTCGTNLTWELDACGTLYISGSGAMSDYYYHSNSPWYPYRGSILAVVIEPGVTSIGAYVFYGCSNLSTVFIGEQKNSEIASALPRITIPLPLPNGTMRLWT